MGRACPRPGGWHTVDYERSLYGRGRIIAVVHTKCLKETEGRSYAEPIQSSLCCSRVGQAKRVYRAMRGWYSSGLIDGRFSTLGMAFPVPGLVAAWAFVAVAWHRYHPATVWPDCACANPLRAVGPYPAGCSSHSASLVARTQGTL